MIDGERGGGKVNQGRGRGGERGGGGWGATNDERCAPSITKWWRERERGGGRGAGGAQATWRKGDLWKEEIRERGIAGVGDGAGGGGLQAWRWGSGDLAFGDGTEFAEAWLGSGAVTPGFVHTTHE